MKKIYNKPMIDVVELRGEFLLQTASEGTETGSQESKRNDFWASEEDEANELSINDVWE